MLSIHVSDVRPLFDRTGCRFDVATIASKVTVLQWLETVQRDLHELSDVWFRMSNAVDVQLAGSNVNDPYRNHIVAGAISLHSDAASRLRLFYEGITYLALNKTRRAHVSLIDALHYLVLQMAGEYSGYHSRVALLDTQIIDETIATVRLASTVLEKEQSALTLLIRTFRTTD